MAPACYERAGDFQPLKKAAAEAAKKPLLKA